MTEYHPSYQSMSSSRMGIAAKAAMSCRSKLAELQATRRVDRLVAEELVGTLAQPVLFLGGEGPQ